MEAIGRYRIVGELGRGAMGVVYHATDPSIGRSVAIKTIRIRDIHDTRHRDKLRERLFREARSAGILSHPNIVTIYDMDESDGLAYIAMAYVNGPTLEKTLGSQTSLSGANMLRILRQTASALDYAHGRGIVHRDIKPANIMTDEDGSVKITDFGIAKITAVTSMTETRTVVGTPNYMSPEQVQGLAIDGRSDQFSLAVIAYEILTGERPFTGEHLSTIVYRIVAEEPGEAQRINTTLTPQIDAVLRRGLAKKPENRYPNCSNFVGALEMACAESRGWTTLSASASAAAVTDGVPAPASAAARAKAPVPNPPVNVTAQTDEVPRRRASVALPLLMSLMVVLGIAGVILWQSGLMQNLPVFKQIVSSEPRQTVQESPPPVQTTPAEPAAIEEKAADAVSTAAPADTSTPPPDATQVAPPVVSQPDPEPEKATPAPAVITPPIRKNKEIVREVARTLPAAPRPQDVWVTTNPPGAKAVLDDDLTQGCRTPCMVHAMTGTHHLTISQAGYENEYREIHVGDTAQDVPPITLRKPSSTLMLTTIPAGASVRVDGKPIEQVTPAAISLPPGTYSITVAKGGQQRTQKIDIGESLVYLRIPLNP
jgi:serine/threonine-protein kinase